MLLSYAGWETDPWVERLPRLLEPMGVTSVRVTSGRSASDVIKSTQIHVAVVDLALPFDHDPTAAKADAEAGSRLLDLLGRLASPPPTVVIKRSRTNRDDHQELSAALKAGAFAVLDRPRGDGDLELLLEVLRRLLKRHYGDVWPTA